MDLVRRLIKEYGQLPALKKRSFPKNSDKISKFHINNLPNMVSYVHIIIRSRLKKRLGTGPGIPWDPIRPKFRDLTVRVFEESGHTPQYEVPALFDAELLRWMREQQ